MSRDHLLLKPYSTDEMLNIFHQEYGSINKHLLNIYSMVIGLNAQRVMDLGAGSTTRVLWKNCILHAALRK